MNDYFPTTGDGVTGFLSDHLNQNQVNVKAILNAPLLENLRKPGISVTTFPRPESELTQFVCEHDFLATPRDDPANRLVTGEGTIPLIHSVFNGEGQKEAMQFPNLPELQIKAILRKYRPFGIAYEGAQTTNYRDNPMPTTYGATVAGVVTVPAHVYIYPGAIICLRLPTPNEHIKRFPRDAANSIKLIPYARTPKTILDSVTTALKSYLYDLNDKPENRHDNNLRRIDPDRNLYENVADALIMFGIEFIDMLQKYDIATVTLANKIPRPRPRPRPRPGPEQEEEEEVGEYEEEEERIPSRREPPPRRHIILQP